MKFELGKVVMTVGANTKLECTSVAEILLGRYANGDWGNPGIPEDSVSQQDDKDQCQ